MENPVKIVRYRVSYRTGFPKESCIIVQNRGKNKESFFPVGILNKRKPRTRSRLRTRTEFRLIPTVLRYFKDKFSAPMKFKIETSHDLKPVGRTPALLEKRPIRTDSDQFRVVCRGYPKMLTPDD